jgi:hypothetical protein
MCSLLTRAKGHRPGVRCCCPRVDRVTIGASQNLAKGAWPFLRGTTPPRADGGEDPSTSIGVLGVAKAPARTMVALEENRLGYVLEPVPWLLALGGDGVRVSQLELAGPHPALMEGRDAKRVPAECA